jgi:hypothetical protein
MPEHPLPTTVKSPLAAAVKLSGVLRLFVRVAVLVTEVPTPTLLKFTVVGESDACRTPVPLRLMVCGLLGALSLINTEPVNGPVEVGAKVKLIVQEALGASENEPVAGQLVAMCGSAKGALGGVMLETTRGAVPVFLSCTDFTALVVPSAWFPKFTVVVLSDAV